MVIELLREACSELTDAWWGRPAPELLDSRPVADLIGLDPLEGLGDWFYSCQIEG
jgi:hypothetical protein